MPPLMSSSFARDSIGNVRAESLEVKMMPSSVGGLSDMTLLPDDFEPGEFDVICSWARQNHRHSGNVRFRKMVDDHVSSYVKAETKYEKTKVIADLIDRVRKESPHGGFVKKDFYTGKWFEIGIERARDKVGHAIRKAADRLVSEQQEGNGEKKKGRGKAKAAAKDHKRKKSPDSSAAAGATASPPRPPPTTSAVLPAAGAPAVDSHFIPPAPLPSFQPSTTLYHQPEVSNPFFPSAASSTSSSPSSWMQHLGVLGLPQHRGVPVDHFTFPHSSTAGTAFAGASPPPPPSSFYHDGNQVLQGNSIFYQDIIQLSGPTGATYVRSGDRSMLPPHFPPPDQNASSSSMYSGGSVTGGAAPVIRPQAPPSSRRAGSSNPSSSMFLPNATTAAASQHSYNQGHQQQLSTASFIGYPAAPPPTTSTSSMRGMAEMRPGGGGRDAYYFGGEESGAGIGEEDLHLPTRGFRQHAGILRGGMLPYDLDGRGNLHQNGPTGGYP